MNVEGQLIDQTHEYPTMFHAPGAPGPCQASEHTSFHCLRGPTHPGGITNYCEKWTDLNLNFGGESDMICVLEYGENIGTLRNLFRDEQQALIFAKHIIALSKEEYTCIATNKWYCAKKDEYVEVQDL